MFGKPKEPQPINEPQPELHLNVMPGEFYGGKDPVISYKKELVSAPRAPSIAPVKQSLAAPAASKEASVGLFKHAKLLIIMGSVVFVAAMAGISWYYIRQSQPVSPQPDNLPPAPVVSPASSSPVPIISTSTTDMATTTLEMPPLAPTTTPSLQEAILEFPRRIFADSADLDGDALTDMEEELFATDSGVYDTDGDGYYDGQEVLNLYNPKGQAPVKLFDSGLVREYINPTWQYRIYYPIGWVAAAVDPASNQVLFSGMDGDYIEVRAVPKKPGETFSAWFGRMAASEQYTDLAAFSSRFSVPGWHRDDNLTAYFDTTSTVYALLYHSGDATVVPFLHIMEMMTQSFRPPQNVSQLPEQPSLPPAPVLPPSDSAAPISAGEPMSDLPF